MHKIECRLTPKIEDNDTFREQAASICDLYGSANELEARGVHVVNSDEKTGVQAKGRLAPTLPDLNAVLAKPLKRTYTRPA